MKYYLLILTVLIASSCIESYNPPVIASAPSYLIVEGSIEEGTTIIKLSRSTETSSKTSLMVESDAAISIEGENGTSVALTEVSSGRYEASNVHLDLDYKYHLKILANNGDVYESEYVNVLSAPPIDSIYWEQTSTGVDIYLNSQDPTNSIDYYKWSFAETWKFYSEYMSFYEYLGDGEMILRTNDIFTCYKSDSSKNILISSSKGLSQNIINRFHVTHIDTDNWRLNVRYSINVKQYPLNSEAFSFYDLVRKNTETLGTFFDPQPSIIRGNITCISDQSKTAIGYVEAVVTTSKRIFIANDELENWRGTYTCIYRNIPIDSVDYYFGQLNYVPMSFDDARNIYTGSVARCVDCTVRGDSTKPEFWR